ncbi:hypothetical protein MJG53_010942 [Ovis ammon polii x Ovis aries]|uniref:Uncharacterized protein n=1 Tax=Ovis ammon polii x Ovis aries TaxID=2918886 RepID=A0ACB9UR25_9CETA|nr:hypothetical protein MJG53_010942 [Ovis ammon polii x Ovis aries]
MAVRSSECARVTCWLPCLYRRPPGPGDGGGFIQKRRRNSPEIKKLRTSQVKRLRCWPHNRVHPSGSTEDLPEEQLEERSISTLEEEALPYSITHEQAGEHAPQEHLVLEPPQAGAEEPPLHPLEELSPNEPRIVHLCDLILIASSLLYLQVALSECESASPHDCCPQTPDEYMADNEDSETMSDNSLIIALENGKNVISDDEKDQEEQV